MCCIRRKAAREVSDCDRSELRGGARRSRRSWLGWWSDFSSSPASPYSRSHRCPLDKHCTRSSRTDWIRSTTPHAKPCCRAKNGQHWVSQFDSIKVKLTANVAIFRSSLSSSRSLWSVVSSPFATTSNKLRDLRSIISFRLCKDFHSTFCKITLIAPLSLTIV